MATILLGEKSQKTEVSRHHTRAEERCHAFWRLYTLTNLPAVCQTQAGRVFLDSQFDVGTTCPSYGRTWWGVWASWSHRISGLEAATHGCWCSARQAMEWWQSHLGKLTRLSHRHPKVCLLGGFRSVKLTLNPNYTHNIYSHLFILLFIYSQLLLMLLKSRLTYFKIWRVAWPVFAQWQISEKAFARSPQGLYVRPPATTTSSESFFPWKKEETVPRLIKKIV